MDRTDIDVALDAALSADIIPLTGDYAGSPGVRIMDYLRFDVGDAVELGVTLLEKDDDGSPRFHWYSDIRGDEHEDTARAILRPVVTAILLALKDKQNERNG